MAIDKKINFEVQGGVKNYLGKQKEVKAPIKWKSSPDHPETELAYITKAEKNLLIKSDLHGSLKGSVNRGPSGIMSLNGYGSKDKDGNEIGMSGAATSDAEAGQSTANTQAESPTPSGPALPPGVTPNIDPGLEGYRENFIAAGGGQTVNPGFFDNINTVSPAELALAKAYNPTAFNASRDSGIMNFFTSGGILGNLVKGVGQKLGYGKKFNEPTYDMSGINTSVYENIPGVSTNPDYYNNLDNEFINEVEAVKPVQTFEFDSSGMNTELPAGQGGATIAELEAMIANAVNNNATQDLD